MKVCDKRRGRGYFALKLKKITVSSNFTVAQLIRYNLCHKCAVNVHCKCSAALFSSVWARTGVDQSCHWHKSILKFTKYSKERWVVRKIAEIINVGPMQNQMPQTLKIESLIQNPDVFAFLLCRYFARHNAKITFLSACIFAALSSMFTVCKLVCSINI